MLDWFYCFFRLGNPLCQTILKSNKKKDAEQELKQSTEITDNNYGFTRGASYYGGKDKC
jgi:transcription termination factor Rho